MIDKNTFGRGPYTNSHFERARLALENDMKRIKEAQDQQKRIDEVGKII